jgi:hypothetical protein
MKLENGKRKPGLDFKVKRVKITQGKIKANQ